MEDTFFLNAQFRKKPVDERLRIIKEMLAQKYPNDTFYTSHNALLAHEHTVALLADTMIESAIGAYPLPLGIVANLWVDDTIYHVPLATEEPSVIAAASYATKIFEHAVIVPEEKGKVSRRGIITRIHAPLQTVQIAVDGVHKEGEESLVRAFPRMKTDIMIFLESLQRRGGGLREMFYRRLPSKRLVVHIDIEVCDAMGANIVNSVGEFIAPHIEKACGGTVLAAILSNYSVERTVHAHITLDEEKLPTPPPSVRTKTALAKKIARMSEWAQEDVYRAVTHNKGIMNAVEALALATGNDSRAMSASAHAYAATISLHPSGGASSYNPLSLWTYHETKKQLTGTITLPSMLATVGGATAYPYAKIVRDILGLNQKNPLHAHALNRVAAAIGLTQNFAALLALCSEGIQKGHLKHHFKKRRT